MTEGRTAAPGPPQHGTQHEGLATGLVVFAAVMLILTGLLSVFRGIMGIAEDDIFVTTQNYAFEFDVTGWGWIHLAIGALAVLVGFGLFTGALWARIAGVALAGLALIVNFLSIPYYPFWAIVLMALDAFIIWALCVARKPQF
ncbi:hypothetical protein [Streptomyces sp. NPDC048639]|uniref:DUF7144 family membrane protein n=1 Tax=Streptomyces sp. NPDC048639 TaxID=3365581 RepID=UPI00371317E6